MTPSLSMNRPPEFLSNITLVDIECRRNAGTGLSFALSKLVQPVDTIKIANMVIQGCVGSTDDSCTHPQKQYSLDYNIGILVSGKEVRPYELLSRRHSLNRGP